MRLVRDGVFRAEAVERPDEGANIVRLDALTLAAARFQLRGAELPEHAPAVDKAVVRGEAAQLVENVAGDEHGDPMLSVQIEDQLTHFDDPL